MVHTVKVRIEPHFRFCTLYYGQVLEGYTVVYETTGYASYEQAKYVAEVQAEKMDVIDAAQLMQQWELYI